MGNDTCFKILQNVMPSGKRLHSYGKIHHVQWVNPCKSTISMGHVQQLCQLPSWVDGISPVAGEALNEYDRRRKRGAHRIR